MCNNKKETLYLVKVKGINFMEQKYYICEHCENIVEKIKDANVPIICCGEIGRAHV